MSSTTTETIVDHVEGTNLVVDKGLPPSKYLCLTILGYRKPGMSEEAYRRHMVEVSAPLTKDLMAKHGIKRWTVMHMPKQTRDLMSELFDRQMANTADYDCFSQVVFESLEHYKNLKADPWYKARLFGDHEKFADTERSSYANPCSVYRPSIC
jgi:hypothetical protein